MENPDISALPSQGGLGLSLSSFTPSIIFGGVVMAIFSLTYYPAYQRRVGPLNACKARARSALSLPREYASLCFAYNLTVSMEMSTAITKLLDTLI